MASNCQTMGRPAGRRPTDSMDTAGRTGAEPAGRPAYDPRVGPRRKRLCTRKNLLEYQPDVKKGN